MILQSLASYYERISDVSGSEMASEGFQKKEIPFVIVIDDKGEFKGLLDTRSGEGRNKRARSFTVPKEIKRSGKNAWMNANLFWDNEGYVLGFSCTDPEKAKKQQESFIQRIKEVFPAPVEDKGVAAVLTFLESNDYGTVFTHPCWPEIEKKGGNITFQLDGETGLICQRQAVIDVISSQKKGGNEGTQTCLVSGEMDSTARLHTAIKGVWGAQTAGANIVSFNLPAFTSYGKSQGDNSPVGEKAEFAYTTALNTLLARDSRQRIQVGDASTVFWTKTRHGFENLFPEFFRMRPKGESEQDIEAFRALYASPTKGAIPLESDITPFYVLGLAPNAARIAVRFWYNGTVGETTKHIRQHFDDCSIIHGPKEQDHLPLFRLLVSTALQGKSENIQPNLSGDVMKAVLQGTPYPRTLLSSVLRRVRAERDITYPRAALIKAVLARESRYYNNNMEVRMSLDRNNNNPGYLLGRLFAVLERAQESANPGINATIRDRFYGAASGTPASVFPLLLKLKNHHIAKLEHRGQAVNLEKEIGMIMDGLERFPKHMPIFEQGLFAVGYYHQRQDFFTKQDNKIKN